MPTAENRDSDTWNELLQTKEQRDSPIAIDKTYRSVNAILGVYPAHYQSAYSWSCRSHYVPGCSSPETARLYSSLGRIHTNMPDLTMPWLSAGNDEHVGDCLHEQDEMALIANSNLYRQ
jgi:hypothetical protein